MPVRTLGAVSASVLAFPLVGARRPSAATIPYPKPTRTLPSALDVAPALPEGHPVPHREPAGRGRLRQAAQRDLRSRTYGILRTCAAEHGEGRALDWMINANNAEQLALANALTRWLAAPDAQGRPGAMAKRFGINYIIWNRQQWRAYDPARGLGAVLRRLAAHRPHPLLVQLGRRLQAHSWWTGVAVTTPLTGPQPRP